ncbi:MAG: SET domain-containing protein-lysine N-methyltransferase [Sphingobacteriaceae bacterium]
MNSLYIAPSAISGMGLFCKRPLAYEERIFSLKGDHIFHDYTAKFAKQGPNWIGIGPNEWIIPSTGSPVLFLNHSCKPNVFINQHLEVIAASPLEANTELLLDYSSTELDPYWEMACACKNENCRKIIKNFESLPAILKVKYSFFVHPSFWKASIEKEWE